MDINTMIDAEFERLMKLIEDGFIYGIKVDPWNIKHIMVASYLIGHIESMNNYKDHINKLFGSLDGTKST